MPSPLTCHPWLASGLFLYLVLAIVVSLRSFLRRASSAPASLRDQISRWMRATLASLEPPLIRMGVRPILLTLTQLGISLLAGAAYAAGCILLGGWLMLGCGVLDLLDGSLARRTVQATRRGAFLDSVIDRYAEFFTFCGLGVLFSNSWMLWVVAFALLGSLMVSYTRARAEGLGVECRGGLMQRAERYILLGGGSFLSTVWNHLSCRPTHSILIISLLLLAVLTNLTALSRVRAVVVALGKQ
ncbi:MAG: CDP-alcohol phosphatidyltransferase family protein [Deltaproteobacteria bacterium]|nr:CDP-alcohol phosphatidyltransferase family protein [Deltaproteobacteria bacterium]